MTNTPKNNSEKRANGCKGYCDRGDNGAKKICNINCRKLSSSGDKSEKKFQFNEKQKEKIKYVISRYSKYINEKNINNYLLVAEINKEIHLILNNKPTELDKVMKELY